MPDEHARRRDTRRSKSEPLRGQNVYPTPPPPENPEASWEVLDSACDALSACDCIKARLKVCLELVSADLAIMFRYEQNTFAPVLHVFRHGNQDLSRNLARALPKDATVNKMLHETLKAGLISENFGLVTPAELMVEGYGIRNIGAIKLDHGPWVVVLINRILPVVGKPGDPDYGAPWDTYILEELRRELRVSPIQISHAIFEREFPRLIKEHPGEWVVYCKDERLGIRATEAEAEQLAIDRGIVEEDTYLRLIEEEPPLSFGCSAGWG